MMELRKGYLIAAVYRGPSELELASLGPFSFGQARGSSSFHIKNVINVDYYKAGKTVVPRV